MGKVSLIGTGAAGGTLLAMGAARARELARGFLQHDPDRWLHVQEVAARAEELRPAVAAADGPVLVVAAWLHDIGYSPAFGG